MFEGSAFFEFTKKNLCYKVLSGSLKFMKSSIPLSLRVFKF